MTTAQSDNFKKVINQKNKRIQWGVATPIQDSPISQNKNNQSPPSANPQQKYDKTDKQKLSKKQYVNGINFQNLPVKESQIIGNYQQTSKTQYHTQHFYQTRQDQNNIQYERQTSGRLNQLKNQFEILKGMMIDSKIMQGNNRYYDKMSNMSGSNEYSSKNRKQKMGQVVRGKEMQSRKSKHSSSSMSQKDLNFRGSQPHKDRSFGFGREDILYKKSHKYTQTEKDEIRGSKISKSKHSQHYSQNPKRDSSKHAMSRVTEKPQHLKVGGFLSNNLLEKQSLQLQLRNSLQKTQILLQNQILLKTKNHQLQETLRKYMSNSTQKDNSGLQNKIEQLQSKIYQYQQRLQNQRNSNRSFIEKIGKLQADIFANQAIIDMLKQQKNKQNASIMGMKLNFANLQIQNKRLQMQRDIDNRESKFQIDRLKKQNQLLRSSGSSYQRPIQDIRISSYENDKIKFLQRQLQQKDRRYKEMIADLENKKYLRDQAQLMKLVESMHKKRYQQEGQGEIGRQLKRLKEQIIKIKNQTDLTQSQFGFESKVISLEQALKKDTQDKQRYLLQVQRFQKDYEQLKTKYKELQAQQTQKQGLILQHSRTQNKLKIDLQQAQIFKPKYEQAQRLNQDLSIRIQQLQIVIRNYQQIQQEVTQLRQALRKKQNQHNLQIKDARRRVDHAEFEAFKTQQQSKFNLDINTRKLSSQIDLLNNQYKLMENDRNYHRDQLYGLRQQFQQLVLKVKDMEFNRDQRIKIQSQYQIQQKQRVKRHYQDQINAINQRFFAQQKRLVQQIGNLTNINQEMAENIRRNLILQSQNNQLRALCKQKISTESSIFHLWEIKQVEYHNVNQILRMVKPSSNTLTSKSNPNSKNINIPNSGVNPTAQLGVFLPQMIQQQMQPPQKPQQISQTQQIHPNYQQPPIQNYSYPPQPPQQPSNFYSNNNLNNNQHSFVQYNAGNQPLDYITQEPKVVMPPILNLDKKDSLNSLHDFKNDPMIYEGDRAVNFY